MSTAKRPRTARRPRIAAAPVDDPGDAVVHLPARALTFDGFRAWVTSDGFPKGLRASFLNGEVYLELALDREPIRVPARASTLAGFRDWVTSDDFPRRLRASYIDKEVVLDMSPEELETHNAVKYEVGRAILNLNRRLRLGRFFGDGTLLTNRAAGLSTEPDGTFVTRESLLAGRVRMVPRKGVPGQFIQLEGTPDWVLEVLSRSTGPKDKDQLRAAYHRAEIPEYWMIDALGPEIDFQILVWDRAGYVPAAGRAGWQHSPVSGRRFRLDRERDEMGLWEYTLHAR